MMGVMGGGGVDNRFTLTDVGFTAYTSTAGKTSAAMPSLTNLGAILFIGQSHPGNHVTGAQYTPTSAANCLQIDPYTGTIYQLKDPMIGPTGTNASPIPRVAQNLITSGKYANVLFANLAVGGTVLGQWTAPGQTVKDTDGTPINTGAPGARLCHRAEAGLRRFFDRGVMPNIVLMIGEQDHANDTPRATWASRFTNASKTGLKDSLDGIGHTGKWLVVQESMLTGGATSANIRGAQTDVIDNVRVFGGVDLDALDAATYRTGDGIHFDAATGAPAVATLLANRIAAVF